jgi:Putative MetA-pathway of phenol degradation
VRTRLVRVLFLGPGPWALGLCLCLFAVSAPAAAQSRPLVTEDPETVPSGHILIEAGLDYLRDIYFPASGLTGSLWRIGTVGVSFGVSSIAELQIDGGLRDRLNFTSINPAAPLAWMLQLEDDTTSDVMDIAIGTKVRFLSETSGRPAMAVRFSTRLPNASNESGLGLDTTDFHFGLGIAKTVQSVRIAGNAGFGILGDPTRGDRQNDVFEYGASVARAVATGAEIVGELHGRLNTRAGTPPIGTESRALARIGARFTRGPVRADGAFIIGVTENDPTWGFTAGLTWVFKAFTVQ